MSNLIYVKTFTVSLQLQEVADATTPDVSPELKDPIKRQEAMKILVQEGRKKVATTSRITQGVGYFADSVLTAFQNSSPVGHTFYYSLISIK